jgi:hypothetical protein
MAGELTDYGGCSTCNNCGAQIRCGLWGGNINMWSKIKKQFTVDRCIKYRNLVYEIENNLRFK